MMRNCLFFTRETSVLVPPIVEGDKVGLVDGLTDFQGSKDAGCGTGKNRTSGTVCYGIDDHCAAVRLPDVKSARNQGLRAFHGEVVEVKGRSVRPTSSTSQKPAVVKRPVFAPFFSMTVFVATVVPWKNNATSSGLHPCSENRR